MKIKHLLLGMLAMAAAVACKQDEPVEEPALNVDKTSVELAAAAGEASFAVTSNQNWVATADADWVSMDPASGAASQEAVTVKVTADDNTTTEARTATVTVKAGALTKTVAVTQAAGAGETPGPGDEPELQKSEWALVGSFGGWDPASELYLSVLDENYFVYYGFEFASDTEFKFLKGGAWPPAGQEIGGNGLVEPNTIQPAGGSNIKVTEAGKYDIYLAADLTKFYIMSEGKLPAEAVEPAPVENSWGMMGCFVDNQWSTDVPMTKEGEWIVAKGAQFTELTFKIRANGSWADATNIGRAPGAERAVVNGKIEVVTAEYAKANLGGDAADIKLNGEPGTYDVYFSFENLEVYVMEAGFKPGEKEPQNPDPVEITYTVVGTIADAAWVNNAPAGLMAKEGDLYIAKNVPFVWNSTCYGGNYNVIEFKILETGTWDGFAYPEKNIDQYANAEITVQIGGENIALNAPEGNYDVYFDKANLKVWVMEAGFKPGEKEPLIPEEVEPVTEGDIWVNDGTVGAATWSGSPYRFAKEGMDGLNECCAQIPAAVWEGMKIAPFCVNVKPATAETEWWQIRVLDGWWTKNDESGASDINPQSAGLVNNGDGTYTFQVDLASNPELVALIDAQHLLFAGDSFIINKMYFGDLPTPGEPEQPELQKSEWALVGSFNNWAPTSDIYLSVLDENYFVYYGFDMPAGGEFKFLKGGVWPPDGQEVGGNGLVQPNTIQAAGGSNIKVNEAGKYDIYLAADLSKFYIMSEGKLPSEATEPAPVEKTWGMMGCFVDNQWSKDVPMTKEGEWIVAKGAQFTELTFKIRANESWADATNIGLAPGSAKGEINTKVAVVTAEYAKANLGGDAADIKLNGEAGTYDVYFSYDNLELYVMTPGYMPGETPAQPEPEPTQDGTEANPYLVADAAALQGMGALLVADATTYFKLTSNIDLAGVEWTPIATTETVDEATVVKAIALDGANFTISNAKDALFSTLCGSVQNLTIDGAAINATNTVGVIANQVNDATIKNVVVKNSSIVSTAGEAGGVVGKLTKGTLENVKVACSVSGTQQLGVLVGRFENGNIKSCTVTGDVTGSAYYIGGLVGLMTGGTIENSSSSANATSASTSYGRVGGLVGQVEAGSISGSNASGSVTSSGHYGGGLIGVLAKDSEIKVSKCYATGSVNLPADKNKSGGAGLIGAIENTGTFIISDCYATANVTAYRWSGPFIGRVTNSPKITVTNSYAKANCTLTQPDNCGAFVGDLAKDATVTCSGFIAWNISSLNKYIRNAADGSAVDVPEGSYFGTEGTISAKAKEFNWDTTIWDLSADDPTLK